MEAHALPRDPGMQYAVCTHAGKYRLLADYGARGEVAARPWSRVAPPEEAGQ